MAILSDIDLGVVKHILASVSVAFILTFALRSVFSWYRLRHIPGPLLPSLTNLPRVFWVKTGQSQNYHRQLHQKYGEVVRMGPNMVSISNPEVIPILYPTRPGFPKSDLYATLRPYSRDNNGLKVVFNTQDEVLHKHLKSPIAPLYSLTNTVTFEPLVDEVLVCLEEQLDKRFSGTGAPFNFGNYLQYFAFDVMGTLTFSKKYGFLEKGQDVHGILAAIWSHWKGSAAVTQITWADPIVSRNRFVRAFRKTGGMAIIGFIDTVLKERLLERSNRTSRNVKSLGSTAISKSRHVDFLDHFLTAKEDNPDLPPWAPTAWMFSNVLAGSDSTATVIRTVMCKFNVNRWGSGIAPSQIILGIFLSAATTNGETDHLLCNPDTHENLYEELSGAGVSMPYPKWAEVSNLPYLDACVQEGIRLHPPFSFHFERIVPAGGIEVLGKFLPEGTVVGGNPWVTNRHEGTFGPNPDAWNPERWLAGGDMYRRKLEQMLLTFGAGRRVCLGKHIGILELKKVVPFLVLNYKMQVVDREAFNAENALFFKQEGFFATLERRT
ncbi:putative benzoate 4-monooxygenase cytochrome P450 [Ustulina deusta]|nr:putative benzoate 4-monooxygenase cytochrome P450 [Ustulina deusta]